MRFKTTLSAARLLERNGTAVIVEKLLDSAIVETPYPLVTTEDAIARAETELRAMVQSYVTPLECYAYMKSRGGDSTVRTGYSHITLTKEQVKNNRFYVGSKKAIADAWGHKTLAEATTHAGALIDEKTNDDELFIVKIVRVVRRRKTPVTVEDVK